jgi:mannan endo-1,4-beta-mannosidase
MFCNKTTGGSGANREQVRAIQPPIDGGGGLRPLGNGVNLQPSYYHGGNVDLGWGWMQTYDTPGKKIKSVRIEIERDQVVNAERWIGEAYQNGYSVIATYHSVNYLEIIGRKVGGTPVPLPYDDDKSFLLDAANWWFANYGTLANNPVRFYVNLMNEWGQHTRTDKNYADAYNEAIDIVRKVYKGPIIIDLPDYGHGAATAANAAPQIKDRNIILSAHIYPNGGMKVPDINMLANTGRLCMVGEFGNMPSGTTLWDDLVREAKSKGWPVLGWAWNGDGTTPVLMNMVTPQFQPNNASAGYSKHPTYFKLIYDLL